MNNSKCCIDCKFHEFFYMEDRDSANLCTHPAIVNSKDIWNVSGTVLCVSARDQNYRNGCGPNAVYFESKPSEFDIVAAMNSFEFIDWLENQSADKIEEYYAQVKTPKKNIWQLIGLFLRNFFNYGGYSHENFNEPTGPPPLKFKHSPKPNIIPKGQQSARQMYKDWNSQ